MTPEQKAAFIISQSICALATIEGMKSENTLRALLGESPAYGRDAFNFIQEQFGIGHNAVVKLFRE